MGGRTVIIFAVAALALLGLCSVAMSRIGSLSEVVDSAGAAPEETRKQLKPTATFNVSERTADGVNVLPATAGVADQLVDPESTVEDNLSTINELLRVHISALKSIPQGGENVDIIQQMTGRNERGIAVIPPGHRSLNEKGELIDRWGTPYHFHPVSKSMMEVRSAGPDRQLWTEDDVALEEVH